MKTVTFKSSSQSKISLLKKIAKEIGVETDSTMTLSDEEMALPGPKPSKKQLESWLAMDDGEKYSMDKAFKMTKVQLNRSRRNRK